MHKIGFITCADLSRYFVSDRNALLTHDDQIAYDYLETMGCKVEPVVWGTPVADIVSREFDSLIVRSPWDYMDSEKNCAGFFDWLNQLEMRNVRILNRADVLRWNLDKHYLRDLSNLGVSTVTTKFLEPSESIDEVVRAFERWGEIVVKPCIAAAAKDAFLVKSSDDLLAFLKLFAEIRGNRAFMIQPFVREIKTEGEWSLVFLHGQYSHAVLKLPKVGGWLVQDELGGSVESKDPPIAVREFAQDAFAKLVVFLKERFGPTTTLLYGRVDVLPGLRIGELELVEPELFFLDRRCNQPNESALRKFYLGIMANA